MARYYGRRRRGPPRRRRRRARTAKDRQQDRAISRINRTLMRRGQYHLNGTGDGTYNAYPLVTPNVWENVFQSNFRANNTDRAYLKQFDIMANITVEASGIATFSPLHYCMFVVSIRKQAQMQTIARLGPSLATMSENLDYKLTEIGDTVGAAQWQLNPAIYKIHAQRRGMVGNYPFEDASADAVGVTNIKDANKNHRVKVNNHKPTLKRTYGVDLVGAPKEWKDLTVNDVNVSDQLFIIFFNNATVDQGVNLAWSCQINLQVPA